MTFLQNGLAAPIVEAIGLALIHFLWQGALIAALLAGCLVLLGRGRARERYLAGCVALVLMPLCFLVTVGVQAGPRLEVGASSGGSSVAARHGWAPGSERGAIATALPEATAGGFSAVPLVAMLWLLGVMIALARLGHGWWTAGRLGSRQATPVADPWRRRFGALSARLGLREPPRLLCSRRVDVPSVVGLLRPVVLIPASCLTGLSPRDLEAVLAHELAHVLRHDYLVNLLQSVVESLLFYHPAVWWVSRHVRLEREHCCDDLAVAACGDPLVYARALTGLEGLRARPAASLALAADGGSLLDRLERVLGRRQGRDRRSGIAALALGLFALLIVAGLPAMAGRGAPAAPAPEEPALEAPTPEAPAPDEPTPAAPASAAQPAPEQPPSPGGPAAPEQPPSPVAPPSPVSAPAPEAPPLPEAMLNPGRAPLADRIPAPDSLPVPDAAPAPPARHLPRPPASPVPSVSAAPALAPAPTSTPRPSARPAIPAAPSVEPKLAPVPSPSPRPDHPRPEPALAPAPGPSSPTDNPQSEPAVAPATDAHPLS